MITFRCLVALLCLLSLLLAAGCGKQTTQKIKGPNGVTMQRPAMSKEEMKGYQQVWAEQKRRQGMPLPPGK